LDAVTGATQEFLMAIKKKKLVKKKPVGRPTKYKPEYCQAIIDYFNIPTHNIDGKPNTPPYIFRFCLSIGISKECLHDWVAKYPEFSDAYRIAKEMQKELMVNNALTGDYNAAFAWRAMMNMHDWREKSDNIHTGRDGEPLFPELSDDDLDARIAALMEER